jgi:hypothetical protein
VRNREEKRGEKWKREKRRGGKGKTEERPILSSRKYIVMHSCNCSNVTRSNTHPSILNARCTLMNISKHLDFNEIGSPHNLWIRLVSYLIHHLTSNVLCPFLLYSDESWNIRNSSSNQDLSEE